MHVSGLWKKIWKLMVSGLLSYFSGKKSFFVYIKVEQARSHRNRKKKYWLSIFSWLQWHKRTSHTKVSTQVPSSTSIVFSLNRVFLKLQFESKHQPLDWSPWSLEWSQLACQGVLMILGDGWLYYCIRACCVTSSCTRPLHVCLLILGCCLIVCIERNKCVQKQQNKQNISPIEMLPDDKRSLNNREQTGDEARVVDHSDDKAYILLEMAFVWRSVLRI